MSEDGANLKRMAVGGGCGCLISLMLLPAYCGLQRNMVIVTEPGTAYVEEGAAKPLTRSPHGVPLGGSFVLRLAKPTLAQGYAMPGTGRVVRPQRGAFLVLKLQPTAPHGWRPNESRERDPLVLEQDLMLKACDEPFAPDEAIMRALLAPRDPDQAPPPLPKALRMGDSDLELVYDVPAACTRFELTLKVGKPKAWQRFEIHPPRFRWFWQRPVQEPD